MEKLKGKMAQEVSKIEERKAKIDDELKEVQVSGLVPVFVSMPISVSYEKTSPFSRLAIPIVLILHVLVHLSLPFPPLPSSLW